jgi:hypothetical protein
MDNASVMGPDIEISFEVTGCNVSSPSSNPAGCHVHKFLDSVSYKNEDGKGFGHYTSAPFTISPIPVGSHEFQLQLIKNDGSDQPFEPLISDTITIVVE